MEQISVRQLKSVLIFFDFPSLSSKTLALDLTLLELGVAQVPEPGT
jgi:hypothetical protein